MSNILLYDGRICHGGDLVNIVKWYDSRRGAIPSFATSVVLQTLQPLFYDSMSFINIPRFNAASAADDLLVVDFKRSQLVDSYKKVHPFSLLDEGSLKENTMWIFELTNPDYGEMEKYLVR